jgi:Sulfotransferase domain
MALRERLNEALRDLPLPLHRAVPPSVRQALRHRLGNYYVWEPGYDHSATPPLEPGQHAGPPDFVGIGVQKAGTTWWYDLIVNHPQVYVSSLSRKERHFFLRFAIEAFGQSDVADYHRWFPRYPGTITGEWTPDYFDYAWVPPLLAEAAPEARLLLTLRDPVQRFRSGVTHHLRNGTEDLRAVFEAVRRSYYSASLRRWLDCFPREQILVLQYEHCVADPASELARTWEFLGLDPDYQPPELRRPVNRTHEGKVGLPEDVERRLREILVPDVIELAKLLPELDLSVWPSVRENG